MILLQAPAKVNLWLRIIGRRDDGFHNLDSLMVPLEIGDQVRVERRSHAGIDFSCSGDCDGVPQDPSNLAWRAADQFFQQAGIVGGVRIELEKNLPHGAGLGGGSSDAASVLMALQRLWKNPLGTDQLHGIASELGSDVPFFLAGEASICRGRGEELSPFGKPAAGWLVLLKPPFSISTPWVYEAYAKMQREGKIAALSNEVSSGSMGAITLQNDLEKPVLQKFFVLRALKNWLLQQPGVTGALLAGSGSTVFAVLPEEQLARELATRASAELGASWWVRVTRLCGQTAKD